MNFDPRTSRHTLRKRFPNVQRGWCVREAVKELEETGRTIERPMDPPMFFGPEI